MRINYPKLSLIAFIIMMLSISMVVSATFYADGIALHDGMSVYTGEVITNPLGTFGYYSSTSCGKDYYMYGMPWTVPSMSTIPNLCLELYDINSPDTLIDYVIVSYNPLIPQRPIIPEAGFTVDPDFEGPIPFYIQFFDNSKHVDENTAFEFNLGDSQIYSGDNYLYALSINQHGSQQYFENTYPNVGNYTVSLTLTNGNGTSTYSEVISTHEYNPTLYPNDSVITGGGNGSALYNINYGITFNPLTPSSNQEISATLTSDNASVSNTGFKTLKYLSISECDAQGNVKNSINKNGVSTARFDTSYPAGINLLKSSNSWYAYDGTGYNTNIGSNTPNPLKFSIYSSGDHYVKTVIIDNNDKEFNYITKLTVSGVVGDTRLTIYPIDASSAALVSGATIGVKNTQSGVWTNKTVNTLSDCIFVLNTGWYVYTVNPVVGYTNVNTGALNSIYLTGDTTEYVTLYAASESATNETLSTVYVTTRSEPYLNPLDGVSVSVNTLPTSYGVSNAAGITQFTLTRNQQYKFIASKLGYGTVTEYYTPTIASDSVDLILESTSGGITTSPTSIFSNPTAEPTYSTAPIVTPFGSQNKTTCGVLSQNATLIDILKNNMACNGIETVSAQNFVIALLIMLGCGYVLSRWGKGIGALAGVIGGFAVSVAMNLIPFWLLIAVLIMCGLIIAGLMFKQSGGNT